MKIAVDTLGGDLGSKPIVDAILDFLSINSDVEIVAFGKKEELSLLEGKCEIVDARDVVPMEAGALEVLHLKNSSMCQAIKHSLHSLKVKRWLFLILVLVMKTHQKNYINSQSWANFTQKQSLTLKNQKLTY